MHFNTFDKIHFKLLQWIYTVYLLQETIGKATAVKYPSKKSTTLADYSQGGVSHRKIAGQTSSGPAHLQTVKVVD